VCLARVCGIYSYAGIVWIGRTLTGPTGGVGAAARGGMLASLEDVDAEPVA